MIGLVLVAVGAFGLVWAPVRAPLVGWGSGEVIAALIAGAVFLASFVAWERRAPYPMLPMEYFGRRGFATANGVAFTQQISLIGSLFIISQLFQIGLGYSPLQAGIRILAWNATLMVVSPIAGALSEKFGDRPFIVLGIIMQVIGLSWLATVVEPGVSYSTMVAPLLVAGIGISMVFPTVANQVTTSVPIEDAGVAAGVNSAMRELGAVFGVAIIALVFANNGSYNTPETFIDGFTASMWAAAAFAAVALIPALLSPGKQVAAVPAPVAGPVEKKI
jgi:MFS family permease